MDVAAAAAATGKEEKEGACKFSKLTSTSKPTSTSCSLSNSSSFKSLNNFNHRIPPYFSLLSMINGINASKDDQVKLKEERVKNFIIIPWSMEGVMFLGFLMSLHSMLSLFISTPIKLIIDLFFQWPLKVFNFLLFKRERVLFHSDLQKIFLIFFVLWILLGNVNYSQIFHLIKAQGTVKLYVIYNLLEVADRLASSFGLDVMDVCELEFGLLFFILGLLYLLSHTMVLFLQMVTLHVAIKSKTSGLLTLLISNQFIEVKSSVFKRFEKGNLFQLTSSDIIERFHLSFFMILIILSEYFDFNSSNISSIIYPALWIILSEIVVDWVKHSFITRFNSIEPSVYGKFYDNLLKEMSELILQGERDYTSIVVGKRLGFSVIPLSVLVLFVILSNRNLINNYFKTLSTQSIIIIIFSIIFFKLSLGYFLYICSIRYYQRINGGGGDDNNS